jgi:hypothetical protein
MDSTIVDSGTINNLTIYYRWACNNAASAKLAKGYLKVGGTEYNDYGSGYWTAITAESWRNDSHQHTTSPDTASAWTWDEINNVQIGVQITSTVAREGRLTQVYMVVDYDKDNVNPELRTTQIYARVNYVPSATSCYLIKPSNYSFGHTREVKKLNTWAGERHVYDLQRSNKTLNMNGIEYNRTESEATTTLDCVMDMKDDGNAITISGMSDPNLNHTWVIRSFNYHQDEGNPALYNWDMELERA